MTSWETFAEARRAAARLEELRLMEGAPQPSGPRREGARACGTGDPTATAAERAIEGGRELAEEERACERAVDEARALGEGVRLAFDAPWWRVLDLHYLRLMGWREVAEETCVSLRTCLRWRDAAFEWIDSVGFARARAGVGIA